MTYEARASKTVPATWKKNAMKGEKHALQ